MKLYAVVLYAFSDDFVKFGMKQNANGSARYRYVIDSCSKRILHDSEIKCNPKVAVAMSKRNETLRGSTLCLLR